MTFGFLVGSKNFIKFFWVSWEDFDLHGYDCIHCVAKSCTTTACRWLFRDSLSSLKTLWSAVIKSPKCCALGTTKPARISARSPYYFRQADITIWVLRKVRLHTVLTRTRFHFYSRFRWKFMRWLGSVLTSLLWVFPKALLKCFHQPNSPWIPKANQAIHAIYLFVLLLIPQFDFCFRFLWIHAAGHTEALHSYFHFSVYLLTSNTDSCDEDDGEVGEGVVEEELADKPGKHKWYIVRKIAINSLAISDEMWLSFFEKHNFDE